MFQLFRCVVDKTQTVGFFKGNTTECSNEIASSKSYLTPTNNFGKKSEIRLSKMKSKYRTRAIITRGLYIFYPIFEDHFFVFKEVFSENSVLMYG